MRLIDIVGAHFHVNLLGIASGLRFVSSERRVLRDYERGHVKEGVGAGAFALLAQLKGVSIDKLVKACDAAVLDLEDIKIH